MKKLNTLLRLEVCAPIYMDETLEKIKVFADEAHGNQTRKYTPDRYIVHPVRVMNICSQYNNRLPVLAAALLHDVLEDTAVGKKELQNFLLTVMASEEASETLQLVVELSDVYTKTAYPRWNRKKRKAKEAARIKQTSGDSQTVRYADIIDNCSEIVEHDPDFAGLFLLECRTLLNVMDKGNEALQQEAIRVVDAGLQRVPRRYRRREAF